MRVSLPPCARGLLCLGVLALPALPVASAAWGQATSEPPGKTAAMARDPAAMTLRDKMVRAYRNLHSYRETVTQRQWKTAPDQASVITIEMRFRRPNRLFLLIDYPQIAQPGRWHLTYACDGKTLIFYNSAKNEFQRVKAPAGLERLALPVSLRGPEFVALLQGADPFADLDKSAIAGYTASFEQSAQHAFDVLRLDLHQDGATRKLRYRLDPKDHLLRGLSLSILPDAGQASPFLDSETVSNVEAEYTQVEMNPRLTDADFTFTPPADAKEKLPAPKKPGAPRG